MTIITADKRVDRLGVNAPIPVEVSRVGLSTSNGGFETRHDPYTPDPGGAPYLTDGGNAIIDCRFRRIRRSRSAGIPPSGGGRSLRNRTLREPLRLDHRGHDDGSSSFRLMSANPAAEADVLCRGSRHRERAVTAPVADLQLVEDLGGPSKRRTGRSRARPRRSPRRASGRRRRP